MTLIKCLLAGVFTAIAATILAIMVGGLFFFFHHTTETNEAIGFDFVSYIKQPIGLFILVAGFLAGFVWKFRQPTFKIPNT